MFGLRVRSDGAAQRGEELVYGRLDPCADVEDADEIVLGDGHVRADDVGDKDVVPRLFAGSVDADGSSVEKRSSEDRYDSRFAVFSLARAVYVSVAERHGLNAVDAAVVAEVLVDGELRAAVRRDGVDRMILGLRCELRLAIRRTAARCENDFLHA